MIKTAISSPKINLFLHITDRLDDGYHALDSLVFFLPDLFDIITLEEKTDSDFSTNGPFSFQVPCHGSIQYPNTIVKTIDLLKLEKKYHVNLQKNIPVQSGLGSASSNAVSCLNLLAPDLDFEQTQEILKKIGSDSFCFLYQKSIQMQGVGEIIIKTSLLPEFYALIYWPGFGCSTPEIYQALREKTDFKFKKNIILDDFNSFELFCDFLKTQTQNDLQYFACEKNPEIKSIIDIFTSLKKVGLARMTGSGSACFALFEHKKDAQDAQDCLKKNHPEFFNQGWFGISKCQ